MKANKNLVIPAIIALLVLAGSGILLTSNSKDNNSNTNASSNTKSSDLETLGVDDLIKNNASYRDKDIYLTGVVSKHSQGYSIFETAKSNTGLRLSVPESGDVKNNIEDQTKLGASKSLTLKGKLTNDSTKGAYFIVSEVK
jgi:hypothetical protein